MTIRTQKDIPDEIKNIVELFYARDEELARSEAQKIRIRHPELSGMINNVLKLMPNAPTTLSGFYNALIDLCADQSGHSSKEEFPQVVDDFVNHAFGHTDSATDALGLGNLFGTENGLPDRGLNQNKNKDDDLFFFPDAKDFKEIHEPAKFSGIHTPVRPIMAVRELTEQSEEEAVLNHDMGGDDSFNNSFFKNLGQAKKGQTQLPSLFDNDLMSEQDDEKPGLRGRKLSKSFEKKDDDFSLDIEVDFDSMGPSVNLHSIINASEPVEATKQRTGQFNAIANPIIAEKASGKTADLLNTPVPNTSSGQKNTPDAAKNYSPSIMRASQMPPNFSENSSSQRINNAASVDSDVNGQMRNITAAQRIDSARQTVPKANAIQPNAVVKDLLNVSRPLNKSSIPQLACRMSELSKRTDINPKGGFLLSLIDGATSVADIIDLSMFSEEETLALLNELAAQQIIDY